MRFLPKNTLSFSQGLDLHDKVVIVTGGSRGIGRQIALLFAGHGAHVVINSTKSGQKQAQETMKKITLLGQKALWIPGDIALESTGKNLITETVTRFGRIDILVSNAGVADSAPLIDMTPVQWRKVLATNLDAAYYLAKPAIVQMVKQRSGGSMIFISSIATDGNPWQANYAASKAGIESFMRVAAREYGKYGIRANAISCGPVETDATKNMNQERRKYLISLSPLGRFLFPEEIAKIALFLASDFSSAINGAVIEAHGGMVKRF